jgi:hypothetical protein
VICRRAARMKNKVSECMMFSENLFSSLNTIRMNVVGMASPFKVLVSGGQRTLVLLYFVVAIDLASAMTLFDTS